MGSMITLFDDRTYEAIIESVKTVVSGDSSTTMVEGWAVDKLRRAPMDVTVRSEKVHVIRTARADVDATFSLPSGTCVGFRVVLPEDMTSVDLHFETPGKTLTRTVDVVKAQRALRRMRRHGRERRIAHYLAHAWTPRGSMALMRLVKRRLFGKQGFYDRWMRDHETMTSAEAAHIMRGFTSRPLVSVVVPVYNVDGVWLRACVRSMTEQWYPNWELCLADDHSPSPRIRPLLEELAASDERIKVVFRDSNGGISRATNSAIELATGDFIGFMDNDDELAPQALFNVVNEINSHPDADFLYTDEDKMTEGGRRFDPFFKPGFSPHLLLGHNYITHFVVVSKQLLDAVGPLRPEFDGSQDYDFVLRATEKAKDVRHIPGILYHWRTLASSVAGDPRSKMYAYDAGRRAIEAALDRRGITGEVRMLDNLGTYKIDYATGVPSVAVLASSYDDDRLRKLESLTDYPHVSFVPVTADSLDDVARSRSEDYLMFLDDLLPDDSSWLTQMVSYSSDSQVAVIGGKIQDPHQRVVNVGVTLRALRSGEPFEMRGEWDEGIGYYFRDLLPREMFGITEDCMMVRSEDFRRASGFDMNLAAGLRGIDLCRRIRETSGKSALWQPYSLFTQRTLRSLTIDQSALAAYLKAHADMADPFAAAVFPSSENDQHGVEFSIDQVDVSLDGTLISVIGWAADLHGAHDVSIALEDTSWASMRAVDRYLRPDVNTALPVPADSLLGFHAEIVVPDGKKALKAAHGLCLVFTTPTDVRKTTIATPSSSIVLLWSLMSRKAGLLRHPRFLIRHLADRYLVPRRQTKAYHELIRVTENNDSEDIRRRIAGFAVTPRISLLVPVYNVETRWLTKCVESVLGQSYGNWELCLADDCSTKPTVRPLLERFARRDDRIKVVFREKNGHISRATNSALEIATGEYVALLDNDDELAPQALLEVVSVINEHPDADMFYSDEDKIDRNGRRFSPHFKPDYSPDLLLSTNYISHLGVYRRSIVNGIGGFRVGYEGSQDYDLALRFTERTAPERIRHIPKVLYHWRTLSTSTASRGGAKGYASDAGLRALRSAIDRRGIDAEVIPTKSKGIYDIHYAITSPGLVSVIIPTKDGYDNIERCMESIIRKTDYPNFEVIIADNGSTKPHMRDLYRRYGEQLGERFRVEDIDIPFNYSRINNLAALKASGKYLLFLNDDTEVIDTSWMTRMVSFAQIPRVGVVGAKLYYPNDTIQHAGVVLGLGGVAGHIQSGFPRGYVGYFGRLVENVNYSAVTAACCMVRAEDFQTVSGFDESLAVAYNDVDLCLRIARLGRDIVWAHEVELYHYESATRGYDVRNEEKLSRLKRESAVFEKRYRALVANDPYYNPNLSRTSGNYWVREVGPVKAA